MRKTKLTVSLDTQDCNQPISVAVEITGPYLERFNPVDLCDDSLVAGITGGVTNSQFARITSTRKEFAKELADNLAHQILEVMQARDTRNGYAKSHLEKEA